MPIQLLCKVKVMNVTTRQTKSYTYANAKENGVGNLRKVSLGFDYKESIYW